MVLPPERRQHQGLESRSASAFGAPSPLGLSAGWSTLLGSLPESAVVSNMSVLEGNPEVLMKQKQSTGIEQCMLVRHWRIKNLDTVNRAVSLERVFQI